MIKLYRLSNHRQSVLVEKNPRLIQSITIPMTKKMIGGPKAVPMKLINPVDPPSSTIKIDMTITIHIALKTIQTQRNQRFQLICIIAAPYRCLHTKR